MPALDAVRGLAILAVTLYRFGSRLADGTPTGDGMARFFTAGGRGVDLFFVLSGFLITGILFDARGRSGSLRNFYARRMLRIFPLYYGVLFAFLIILPWVSPEQQIVNDYTLDHQGWLWLYGSNFLMARDWLWPLGVFNHFWSLAVEEHYYLIWPFVIRWLSRRGAMNACLFLVGIAMTSRIVLGILQGNFVAAEVATFCRMDALAIGSFLALAVRGPDGWAGVTGPARRWGMLCLLVLVGQMITGRGVFYIPLTLQAIVFASLIVWSGCATDRCSGWLWQNRWLRGLGQYAYGMYVFQNLLVPLVDHYWPAESLMVSLGPVAGRLAYVALGFAVTLVTAILSWHAYEKHFLRWKRHFTDGPPAVTSGTASPR